MMKLLLLVAICEMVSVSLAVPVTRQNSLNEVEHYAPGYDRSGEQLVRNTRQFSSVDIDVINGMFLVLFHYESCINIDFIGGYGGYGGFPGGFGGYGGYPGGYGGFGGYGGYPGGYGGYGGFGGYPGGFGLFGFFG